MATSFRFVRWNAVTSPWLRSAPRVHRYAARRLTAALTLSLTSACSVTPETSGLDPCAPDECPCKITDPTEHCVRLDGCRSDRDCPAGTICLPAGDVEPPLVSPFDQCVPPEAARTRCRIAAGSFDRALIDGFRTNEFRIESIPDTIAFTFSPPPEATIVTCALFGCRPDIVSVSRTDVVGKPAGDILNYEQCSLSGAPQIFNVSPQSTMASESLAFTPSVSPPSAAASEEGVCSFVPDTGALPGRERQLIELGVGCWAYDDSRLIAATRIEPVPPDQIAAISNIETILSPDCLGHTEKQMGKSCLLDGLQPPLASGPEFGACFDGRCLPRCVTAADCPEHTATKECPHPAPRCLHDGPPAENLKPSFLGICDYDCERDEVGDGGGP
ncbi:MAG: hypothetical protein HUU21_11770 [Polyangiaceae bacterium]|nr:hypothetical protein [Polyangiaceae bacterium]